jgi:hypothetical protein
LSVPESDLRQAINGMPPRRDIRRVLDVVSLPRTGGGQIYAGFRDGLGAYRQTGNSCCTFYDTDRGRYVVSFTEEPGYERYINVAQGRPDILVCAGGAGGGRASAGDPAHAVREVIKMTDPRLRASDADRERVVTVLHQQVGEGRLTLDEYSERAAAVYQTRTMGELDALTGDLPTVVSPSATTAHRSLVSMLVVAVLALLALAGTLLALAGPATAYTMGQMTASTMVR